MIKQLTKLIIFCAAMFPAVVLAQHVTEEEREELRLQLCQDLECHTAVSGSMLLYRCVVNGCLTEAPHGPSAAVSWSTYERVLLATPNAMHPDSAFQHWLACGRTVEGLQDYIGWMNQR